MRAGPLRHQITIESKTVTRGTLGGTSESWTTFVTTMAQISPLRGREYFEAQATQNSTEYKIITRYVEGVTAGMRVSYNGDVYNITAVINPDLRNRYLELMATKGGGDG